MAENLLVVDWDYFFPNPEGKPNATVEEVLMYDWGHNEGWGAALGDAMWTQRAAAFDRVGWPRPQMNLEWTEWWQRFNIAEGAILFYADSNLYAWSIYGDDYIQKPDSIWLYDAHHDSGYTRSLEVIQEEGKISCEDWMVAYYLQGVTDLHVRYPRWKPWAMQETPPSIDVDRQIDDFDEPNSKEFTAVFVCRSGAWVPPWCDLEFWDFITDAPVGELYEIGPEYYAREWNEEWVEQNQEAHRKLTDWAERGYPKEG